MKRICFLLFSSMAFGQGSLISPQQVLKTVNGITSPVPLATVTVCAANVSGIPCAPALVSAVFKDAALTQPLPNPFTADVNGNYQFAIASGTYTVTTTAAGFVGYSYQLQATCPINAACTWSAAQSFTSTVTTTNTPGTFTGASMQEYLKSVVGSCTTLTEFLASGAFANGATLGVSGCTAVPGTATNIGAGVAGFANTLTAGGAGAAIGLLGQGRAIGNDSLGQGLQTVASDITNAGFTNMELISSANLVRTFNGSASNVYEILDGVQISSFFTNQPAKFWSGNSIIPIGNGFHCQTANTNQWNNCSASDDGASALFAFIGTTSSASGASDSQPIQGSARASGTADTNAQIIFVHAAPSGACPALATFAVNVAGATNSTAMYVCTPGNTWSALPQTVASGTATMTTASIAAVSGTTVTCGTTVTVAATGVLNTDVVTLSFVGAQVSPNTGLITFGWTTAGNVNFFYCNPTASALTPVAATINWKVVR